MRLLLLLAVALRSLVALDSDSDNAPVLITLSPDLRASLSAHRRL